MKTALFILVAVSIVVATTLAIGFRDGGGSPHAFTDSDCFLCHFTLPREGGNDGEPLRFTDSITRLCARCHDMSGVVSHQVEMVPSADVKIPPDMPLDENGRVTCVTCHDVHKPYKNPLTGERTYFLRRDVLGKNFCIACHINGVALNAIRMTPEGPVTTHKPAMDKAHGFAHFEVLDPASPLDPLSLACLDCHDDSPGSRKTTLGEGVWKHATEGIGLSHPIGMDYYRATINHKDLVPERDLDKKLRLFDGKMGCCTCHDPYAPGDGRSLVIGTKESYQDLCFACHIK